MSYEILYTRRAVRDIEKLPPEVKKRIGKGMLKLLDDPFLYIRKLINSEIGSYRYRIGEYRAVLDIQGQEIVVLRIGHRRDIYRKVK
ncbi:MAG: type II toxin-antitoxin system RelE/ParE family toxin [Desulfobacterales bacterium]|nr:type II toxin-antitoxin system RelE/ParE family toxin [Desulfobacterales bacterium]